MKKILLLSLLFSLKQINAQFCFAPVTNYSGPGGPRYVCSTDFNNDGFPDLASANFNANNVCVFINTGLGTFLPSVNYNTNAGSQGVESGDFNNDGNKDLVVANYNANNFSILLGSPTGTFTPASQFGMASNPSAITVADFNGDGNRDVVTCNQTSGNISLRLGNGLGGFTSFTNTPIGPSPRHLINGDFNNDGNKDLAIASFGGNSIFILIGNGLGGFGAPSSFAVSSPLYIASGYFNGDANLDLAVAGQSGGFVSVLIGDGLGGFGTASNFGAGSTPQSVSIADFDNDGNLDLVVGISGPNVAVLMGDGLGSFGAPSNFSIPSPALSVVSGDFNMDGKADIAASANSSNFTSVLLNSLPQVNITGSTTVCYFMTTLLTATGAGSYTWSPSSLTTNTINFSGCCTTTVAVTGTNSGCAVVSTKIVTITINALPTVTFAASSNSVCSGNSATITAGGASTYTWVSGPTTNSIIVTPTATTVYTVTGTSSAGCQSIPYTFTLTQVAKPTVIVNSPTICAGVPTLLTGGGANTYSWSTTATTSTISVAPTSNTNYTVIGTAANTCTNIAVSNVSVNPLPTVTGLASPTAVCSGSLLTLNGAGASTYTWNGGITNNVAFTATATQVYSVTGTNSNGCVNSGTINVTMMSNPIVVASGTSLICLNKPQTLTASGAATYTWIPGSVVNTTITATPTVNTTYTVTGIAANGCRNAGTIAITLVQPPIPDICQVTVDSLGFNNEIYYDKTLYPSADSFIVYREVSTNIYKRIASLHKSLYSMYVDTNRSVNPANGDPNLTYYKYKMQLRDTCGNYSAMSKWHETIFIQDQQNGNFNWNMYAIESSSTPVANYNLKRRMVSTGTETLIVSTVGGLANDPAYASFWPLNVKWFVDAIGFSCNTTLKLDPNNSTLVLKNKTKSNQSNDKLATGINNYTLANNIRIYPNPTNDILNVDLNSLDKTETTIEIQNTLGQIVYQTKALNQHLVINTNTLAAGVYMVNIKQNNQTIAVKKVIVDK